LSWLCPDVASLQALCRFSPDPWPQVRDDPAAILLLLRSSATRLEPDNPVKLPRPPLLARAQDANLFTEVLLLLEGSDTNVIDIHQSAPALVFRLSLTLARVNARLAASFALADPDEAWICGLLAPLGWLALTAMAPGAVAECLGEIEAGADPAAAQVRHLGIEVTALARRLARCWGLPGWAAAPAGNLGISGPIAADLGADPTLLHLTRLSVAVARRHGQALELPGAQLVEESTQTLGRPSLFEEADRIWDDCARQAEEVVSRREWRSPHGQDLVRDLLSLAADNRRLRSAPAACQRETEIDRLHTALEEQLNSAAGQLESAKLAALAEFAAGAGHEINNPLAVISGQAQYLLAHQASWLPGEAEGQARKALQTIIAQTRRIHSLLRDLMQFARPTEPSFGPVDLPSLAGEVAGSLGELAGQRRVRIEVHCSRERLQVQGDVEQLRLALGCLVRNAVEAAPADGWVRLSIHPCPERRRAEVAVEDNGPGPEANQRPHLFDPFFSGRTAGRGRGLGLPIAWRLARLQGGEVWMDSRREQEPTRFILSLPWVPDEHAPLHPPPREACA